MRFCADPCMNEASWLEPVQRYFMLRRSPQVAEAGHFFSFWDTVSYAVNGLVFFFAGASAVNFFIRYKANRMHVHHAPIPIAWHFARVNTNTFAAAQ